MKRLLVIALTFVLLLAACSPNEVSNGTPDTDTSPGIITPAKTALRIGNTDISTEEYRYHYYSVVQSIVSVYGAYMGIDMDTPFEEQKFDDTMTWAEFFEEQAVQRLQNAVLLSEQAKKENMTLSPVFADEIQKQIDSINQYGTQEGKTFKDVMAEAYGGSIDETALRAVMERIFLGYQHEIYIRNSLDISNSDVEKYYRDNSADYDEVDYLLYMFYPEYGEDGFTVTDSSKAKADAEAFLANVTDRDSFSKYVTDVLGEEADSVLIEGGINEGDPVSAWLYDVTRNEGDTAVVDSDGIHSVLYFIERYQPRDTALSVRHALIASENSTAEAAREKAEGLYDGWKAGPATEKTFVDMVLGFSQDPGSVSTGGLYEDIQEGQMVETFNDWCFDTTRKYGDTGLVDTTYGTHIMFYVGYVPTWENRVRLTIMENNYIEFYDELLPNYENEKIDMDVSK